MRDNGARLAAKYLTCAWDFWWDPPEGFVDVDVTLHNLQAGIGSYTSTGNGLGGYASVEVTLDATYLPSTAYGCGSFGAVVWPSAFGLYDWLSYDLQWTNTDCDGHPVLQYGNDPTNSYWVSEEMYNTNSTAAFGAEGAGVYWSGVGQDLNYTTLTTPTGGESGVYPHPFPSIGVVGHWDSGSDQIWLNTVHHSYTSAQWGWVTAHELGHAIGFGHSGSFDHAKTIMMESGTPGTDLTPRTLEKCGAVRSFPVNIKIS